MNELEQDPAPGVPHLPGRWEAARVLGRSFTKEMALRAVILTGGCASHRIYYDVHLMIPRFCISSHEAMAGVNTIAQRADATGGCAASHHSETSFVLHWTSFPMRRRLRKLNKPIPFFSICMMWSTLWCSPGGLVGGPAISFGVFELKHRAFTPVVVHPLGTWRHVGAGEVLMYALCFEPHRLLRPFLQMAPLKCLHPCLLLGVRSHITCYAMLR